ncbi:MAG: aminopeptidase P N-terminal domain-containing protein [Flavobacteriales bacterium]
MSRNGEESLAFSQLPLFPFFLSFSFLLPLLSPAQRSYPASLPKEFHENRRELLRDSLKGLSMAAFFSAPVRPRSKDINYGYVQDKDFYYFTGCREKNSLLLVFSDTVSFDSIRTDELLFLPRRTPARTKWEGPGLGIKGAEERLGITKALPHKAFTEFDLHVERYDHIYWLRDKRGLLDNDKAQGDLYSLYHHFKRKTKAVKERRNYERLDHWRNSMREIKQAPEIRFLERAIDVTEKAHRSLMKACRPGIWEYQAEALIEYVFRANGCKGTAFPSIVGSGPNSCILHYSENGDRMKGSEVAVVDIGAEYGGYAADITRTLPVDGTFSKEERAIYELVLKAQKAGIRACQPGRRFYAPNQAARKVVQKGLRELGILGGKNSNLYDHWMHKSSHYLGLDVHDVGRFGDLRPGNVLTVEPGVYIPEGSNCPVKWWNIGVRIEDDILITENGHRNLSGDLPRKPEEVEKLMKDSVSFSTFGKSNKKQGP